MIENWGIPPPFLSSLAGTVMLVSQMLSLFVKYLTQYPIKLPDSPLSTLLPLKHYQPSPEMMNLSEGGLLENLCNHCRLEEEKSKLQDLGLMTLPGGQEHKYTVNHIINQNFCAIRNFEVRLLGFKGRGEKSQKIMLVLRC